MRAGLSSGVHRRLTSLAGSRTAVPGSLRLRVEVSYRPRVKSFRRSAVLGVSALFASLACAPSARVAPTPAPAAGAASGIDLDGIDRSVAPGDDFYRYANGEWLTKTEIPADRSAWGVIERPRGADLETHGGPDRRDGEVAGAGGIGRRGRSATRTRPSWTRPRSRPGASRRSRPALERVAAIGDRADLARALGETLRADVDVLNNTNFYTPNVFGLWVAQDLDEPSRYAPFLLQGGLGMPDRDYYLDPSPRWRRSGAKYQAHVERMLTLAGISDAAAKAARIFELERKIASVHVSREDSEDVLKGNNHWARADFAAKAPGLDWTRYFEAAGLGGQASVVVWQPGAVTGLAALALSEPLDTWKEYLTFRVLSSAATDVPPREVAGLTFLPKAFVDERVRVLWDDAHGRAEAPRPLEARVSRDKRRARRGRRPALRRDVLPAVREGPRRGDGEERDRSVRGEDRPPRLDGARDEGEGQGEARRR